MSPSQSDLPQSDLSALGETRMPTYFIPHGGGPCFFMDWTVMGGRKDEWDRTADFLRGLLATLPHPPKGVVVISGHWEEAVFTASTAAKPDMIFDYYGFPPHTYELDYPARGAPDLARRVVDLIRAEGLPAATTDSRGFDHGIFVPFLLIDPQAQLPIVPLSLKSDLDPQEHLRVGRALAALRDEGILIVGSGMSFHNMRAFRSPAAAEPSMIFDAWLTETLTADPETRWNGLTQWSQAPAGRASHPREEHLIPLMVAAGAADRDPGTRPFSDTVMYADVSAFRFG